MSYKLHTYKKANIVNDGDDDDDSHDKQHIPS